ncbi:MAG: hypothetical protein DME84_08555 [Verrucomicrobia bacterium]|jgi:hypothetical protein|nr:MAG: hypothetical protein DME84_08555 [Verrucomicrobiota bacterium]
MPDLPISKTTPEETSAAPADFTTASLFRSQKQQNDPVRKAILIGLAIVLLVFLLSMIAVMMMHAPSL